MFKLFRNVRVDRKSPFNGDPSTVRFIWDAPLKDGSNGDLTNPRIGLWYSLHCQNCPPKVSFHPMRVNLRDRVVSVAGLAQQTTYYFRVYSDNRKSTIVYGSKLKFAEFNYTTPAAGMIYIIAQFFSAIIPVICPHNFGLLF